MNAWKSHNIALVIVVASSVLVAVPFFIGYHGRGGSAQAVILSESPDAGGARLFIGSQLSPYPLREMGLSDPGIRPEGDRARADGLLGDKAAGATAAQKGALHNGSGAAKTAQQQCDIARAMQVCSHRGMVSSEDRTVDLKISLPTLARQGVFCSDLDVFRTKDSFLLVGRPSDIENKLLVERNSSSSSDLGPPPKVVGDLTYRQIQDMAPSGYPILVEVLQEFKSAITMYGHLLPEGGQLPLLLLEFKGRAMSHDSISYLGQQSQLRELHKYIHLWSTSSQDAALVIQASSPTQLLTIRGILDSTLGPDGVTRIPIKNPLADQDILTSLRSGSFSMSGPSIKHDEAILSALKGTGRKMVAWIVDTKEDLDKAIRVQADAVVSNKPLWIKSELKNFCTR